MLEMNLCTEILQNDIRLALVISELFQEGVAMGVALLFNLTTENVFTDDTF